MTIAIDFDGTWTLSPDLWNAFRVLCLAADCQLIMVTGRTGWSDDMGRYKLPPDMPIYYTAGAMKEAYMRKQGVKVDVWIDDMPAMIQECAVLLPGRDKEL